jgi:hypothetical protein
MAVYVARIEAARLDGAQLLGIGAEIFADPSLDARARQLLIARAAANRSGAPHEHTRCRQQRAERCAYCLKGPGPGLSAADGRWFGDACSLWRDRDGRPAAPVPPDQWQFVGTQLVERAVGGQQHLCASCVARHSPGTGAERTGAIWRA